MLRRELREQADDSLHGALDEEIEKRLK